MRREWIGWLSALFRRPARFRDLGFPQPPDEMWRGHPVWISVMGDENGPTAAIVAIGVVSPGRLQVARRPLRGWNFGAPPKVDVPRVPETLDVRSDDVSLAHRLFADETIVRTLPMALLPGEKIEVFENVVRVYRKAINYGEKDAVGSARATAMAVVSALKLPAPPLP